MSGPEASTFARPELSEHFERGSLLGLLRRRHPYDFADTYRILRQLLGYSLDYVNLGLWDEGPATVEPGQRLAFRVLDELELEPGARLIDAGSGLGQAAVDACDRYAAAWVLGINPNVRQVGYASALAAAAGFADRIQHRVADACVHLASLPPASFDGVVAIECMGHLPDPEGFLAGVHHVLKPGGRLAFCLNTAGRELGWWLRLSSTLSYGFVPAPLERWLDRLRAAGLAGVRTEDLTERVLAAMATTLLKRIDENPPAALSQTIRLIMRFQLASMKKAVEDGRLRYMLVSAARL